MRNRDTDSTSKTRSGVFPRRKRNVPVKVAINVRCNVPLGNTVSTNAATSVLFEASSDTDNLMPFLGQFGSTNPTTSIPSLMTFPLTRTRNESNFDGLAASPHTVMSLMEEAACDIALPVRVVVTTVTQQAKRNFFNQPSRIPFRPLLSTRASHLAPIINRIVSVCIDSCLPLLICPSRSPER